MESVESKFSRLAHRFVSAEEANTAFFWCLGILLTRSARSVDQKPQENETLLQQTKFVNHFILFARFIIPAILAAVRPATLIVRITAGVYVCSRQCKRP